MGWNTILFDLDGTITDPKEGITKAVATALTHFGIEADPDTLTHFIGPPLLDEFAHSYGFDEAKCVEAVIQYRLYYNRQGWLENVPYESIDAFLQGLLDAGKRLAVATSKPEPLANRVLEHFGLAKYFALICGATPDSRTRSNKTMVIQDALKRLDVTDLTDVVMVGDRHHDIDGANNVGLASVGVLYGYGSREELETAGATHIAPDLNKLMEILK